MRKNLHVFFSTRRFLMRTLGIYAYAYAKYAQVEAVYAQSLPRSSLLKGDVPQSRAGGSGVLAAALVGRLRDGASFAVLHASPTIGLPNAVADSVTNCQEDNCWNE